MLLAHRILALSKLLTTAEEQLQRERFHGLLVDLGQALVTVDPWVGQQLCLGRYLAAVCDDRPATLAARVTSCIVNMSDERPLLAASLRLFARAIQAFATCHYLLARKRVS